MSSTAHQRLLKMRATTAAADTDGTAVALTGTPAEFVSFQWHHTNVPPTQNVNSAGNLQFVQHSLVR